MSLTKIFLEQCAADWGMTTDEYLSWVRKWNNEEAEYEAMRHEYEAIKAAVMDAEPGREGCPSCNAYYCGDGEGQSHRYDCGSELGSGSTLRQSTICKERGNNA